MTTEHDHDDVLQAELREALQAELARMAPDAGLDRLHARLQADAAHAATPAAAPAGWRAALRGWFTRWPTALASLVIVVQAGLLGWQAHRTPDDGLAWRGTDIGGLGGVPDAASTATLAVRFAPQAPLSEITALLQGLQAQAIAGPDADGHWTLAVPLTRRDASLARLRASPLVQSVTGL